MPSLNDFFEKYAAEEGIITWPFHQADIIRKGRRGGICAALCAYWIKCHSHDQHLKSVFYDDEGNISDSGLREICNLQDCNGPTFSGLLDRDRDEVCNILDGHQYILRWLSTSGIYPLRNMANQAVLRTFDGGIFIDAVRKDCCTQSHLLVNSLMEYMSCYMYICVGNQGVFRPKKRPAGHALAAWMGNSKSDVCFFDPNVGEVWFQHRGKFTKFARDYLAELMLKEQYYHWYLYPVIKSATSK